MAGGVQHAGAGICHVGDDGDELQGIHEAHGGLAVALDSEGDDAAGAVGHVLLCQGVVLVGGQAAVVYPCHARIALQELCHALGVLAVAGHAQMEGLQTEVQQEGVLRSGDAAEVAHELGDELGGVGHLSEGLGVGQAVVGLVGGCETGELLIPLEVAAINYAAADLCGVTVHVFRGGVGDDVGAPFEGTAVDGRGEGVVNNEGNAMLVGDAGKLLDVENLSAGVGDGLAEEGFRIGTEGLADFFLAGFL